jgi:hypothetical protein
VLTVHPAIEFATLANCRLSSARRRPGQLHSQIKAALDTARAAEACGSLTEDRARELMIPIVSAWRLRIDPVLACLYLEDAVRAGSITRRQIATDAGRFGGRPLSDERSARRVAKRKNLPALSPATMKLMNRHDGLIQRLWTIARL